jgi:tetratricopeptide (TPR) repeat protein
MVINYIKFKHKSRESISVTPCQKLVERGIHSFELTNERQARQLLQKATKLSNNFISYYTLGGSYQGTDIKLAVHYFEKAKEMLLLYPEEQDIPEQQRNYLEMNSDEYKSHCIQQLVHLCDALILDTTTQSSEAIELMKKTINDNSIFDKDVDFNQFVEQVNNEQDNYIMFDLYTNLSYAASKIQNYELGVKALMVGIAYGPRYSLVSQLCFLSYFMELDTNFSFSTNKLQYLYDAREIDNMRYINGAYFVATALQSKKEPDKAIQLLEDIPSKFIVSSKVYRRLAECYKLKGMKEEAEKMFIKAIEYYPSDDYYSYFSLLYHRVNDNIYSDNFEQEANRTLEMAINNMTDDRYVYLLKGLISIDMYIRTWNSRTSRLWYDIQNDRRNQNYEPYLTFTERANAETKYSSRMKRALLGAEQLSDVFILCNSEE